MARNFDKLSKEEVQEIIDKYYKGIKNQDIIDEYDLDLLPGSLVKCFPPQETDKVCPYCGTHLMHNYEPRGYIPVKDRGKVRGLNSDVNDYCPSCGHKPNVVYCNCEHCEKKRAEKAEKEKLEKQKALEAKKETVRQLCKVLPADENFYFLDLNTRINFCTICSALLKDDLKTIERYDISEKRLFVDHEELTSAYKELHNKNVLGVSPESDLDAFFDEDFPYNFNVLKVRYYPRAYLWTPDDESKKLDCYENWRLILGDGEWYIEENEYDDVVKMWKKFLVDDCIEYLNYEFADVGFSFTPGVGTRRNFEEMLRYYSVSQVYNFIYKAVANASRTYLAKNLNKRHAANLAVSNCKSYCDRAKAANWDIKKYEQPYALLRPEKCDFFFDCVVRIGSSAAFDQPNFGLGIGNSFDDKLLSADNGLLYWSK